MSLSGDFKFKLIVLTAVVGAAAYIAYRAYKKIDATIPQVVKDGLEATYILAREAANIVSDPLDGFGIVPADEGTGKQKWVKTTPFDNPNDPVSNNDSGINYNLF